MNIESPLDLLMAKIKSKKDTIYIMGLGRVGLPLVSGLANRGFYVVGIDINDLQKLFEQFATILKKDEMIIISCLPRYSRVLECILTFFTDHNLFKRQVKQFLNSSYRETKFYRHSIDELRAITKNHFILTKIKNIEPNSNRDTCILKKISK